MISTCGEQFIDSFRNEKKVNLMPMATVHPFRYREGKLEFLLIKRATVSWNWQGVTGSTEEGETLKECAIRELFEETGYSPAFITSIEFPPSFYKGVENRGERIPEKYYDGDTYKQLEKGTYFAARIDQTQEPIIDPEEHTEWIWCNFERAYDLIMWDIEKRVLRFVNMMIVNGELKENKK
jgi:8-oxo-dGTP pyrophosphatase MutT (NUDIX family)